MYSPLVNSIRKGTQQLRATVDEMKFDPSQPRVPAGNSNGGQWSDSGGGGSSGPRTSPGRQAPTQSGSLSPSSWKLRSREKITGGERTIHNGPGGAVIASERCTGTYTGVRTSRHAVLMPDGSGLKVENDRFGTQHIFDRQGNLIAATRWSRNGPQAEGVAQEAFFDDRPGKPGIPVPPSIAALTLYNWYLSSQNLGGLPVFGFRAAKFIGTEGLLVPTYVGRSRKKM